MRTLIFPLLLSLASCARDYDSARTIHYNGPAYLHHHGDCKITWHSERALDRVHIWVDLDTGFYIHQLGGLVDSNFIDVAGDDWYMGFSPESNITGFRHHQYRKIYTRLRIYTPTDTLIIDIL